MTKTAKLVARIGIALCLGLMTLAVLDERNPVMKFLTSNSSKIFLAITCIFGVIMGVTILRRETVLKDKTKQEE